MSRILSRDAVAWVEDGSERQKERRRAVPRRAPLASLHSVVNTVQQCSDTTLQILQTQPGCGGLWGMGQRPMTDRSSRTPRLRDTRSPYFAAAASVQPGTASRMGRGVLFHHCAAQQVAIKTRPSCPEKQVFLGHAALFFIARNEGSSMLPDNYACIHRMKLKSFPF